MENITKFKFNKIENITKKSNLTRLNELAWNQRWPYHKVKCQPSISSDKYLDQESCKKLHTKTHKIYESMDEINTYYFHQF